MKIQQVNNVSNLNQQLNSEKNYSYYKTSPKEYDSVNFKGGYFREWMIPKLSFLQKLRGVSLSAAALWAVEKGFDFIPFKEEEIDRSIITEEKEIVDIPTPERLDIKNTDMYNIPILYDKDTISKLKDDELIQYVKDKGIKLDDPSITIMTGSYNARIKSLAYVLPLEEGTKLTIDNKEIVVPKGQVCLLRGGELATIPFYQFHRTQWVLPSEFGQKAEYKQFMELPYYNSDGNIVVDEIGYQGKPSHKATYNTNGLLIRQNGKDYEYDDNERLIRETGVYTITEYLYNDNVCTKTTKAKNQEFRGEFEVIKDGIGGVNIKCFKKGNLTVIGLNPKFNDKLNRSITYSLNEAILGEIDREYQAELAKNSELKDYDVFIDMYNVEAWNREIYKPIVTVKDKKSGEIISVKQGYFKDVKHKGQTYFGLDNINLQ